MRRLIMSVLAAGAAIGVLLTVDRAWANAAPAGAGGVITVNTSNDPMARDGVSMSFREAISITNGALKGPFTLAEKQQMAGCAFNASGLLTGGCGMGNDTIRFVPTLTNVLMAARPPAIGPVARGLTVDGAVNSGVLILDGRAGADAMFDVGANDVTLKNLAVINVGGNGAGIGSRGQPHRAAPTGFGAAIGGNGGFKGLQVLNSYLGVLPDSTSCSDPRLVRPNTANVFLSGGSGTGSGDATAYLANNVIGCALRDGIYSEAAHVVIGIDRNGTPGRNTIGTDAAGHNLGNGLAGPGRGSGIHLCCTAGTAGTEVVANTIAYNSFHGIALRSTSSILVQGNEIHHNDPAGIFVESSGFNKLPDNLVHDNISSGVWLTGTLSTANAINGGAYTANGAAGITEGEGAAGNIWFAISTHDNFGLGVDKFDNGLPDPPPVTIDSMARASTGVTVTGRYSGSMSAGFEYRVDLYRSAADPGGYGEGRAYVGSAFLAGSDPLVTTWQVVDPKGPGCYTAIVTVINGLVSNDNTSSEFARNTTCTVFAPLIRR
jgi:parallel beta-helix repeat protein